MNRTPSLTANALGRRVALAFRPALKSLCCIALLCGMTFPVFSQYDYSHKDMVAMEKKVQKIVRDATPATVCILSRTQGGSGSAVIVSKDGLMLTAAHVIGESTDLVVIFPDGKRAKAKALGCDYARDIAMAQITDEGEYPFVEVGNSDDTDVTEIFVALGHAGGFDINRPPPARIGRAYNDAKAKYIMTDCVLIGGDSGGPLFDLDGKVVGIHSSIGDNYSQNNHAPVGIAQKNWARLLDGDRWGGKKTMPVAESEQPVIGVRFEQEGEDAVLAEIFKGTPADEAGLKAGDKITKIDGKAIGSKQDFYSKIADYKAGDTVAFEVERKGKAVKTKLVLKKRSDLYGKDGKTPPVKPEGKDDEGKDGADEGKDGADEGQDGADEGKDGADKGKDGADEGQDGTDKGKDGTDKGKDGADKAEDGDAKPAPAARPFIGVVLDETDDGLSISKVLPDSSAAKAGLKVGDEVIKLDGKAVADLDDVRAVLKSKKIGDILKAELKRDGKSLKKDIKLFAKASAEPKPAPKEPEAKPAPKKPDAKPAPKKPDANKADPKSDKAAPAGAKPFLGLVLEENGNALEVGRVVEGASAAKAGLKVGDRLAKLHGKPVSKLDQVREILKSASVGDVVKAEYLRGGKAVKTDITLQARPGADKAPSDADESKPTPKKEAKKPDAKPAPKKPEAKKPAPKKPDAKPAPKKPEAKKPAPKKPEAKKPEAKPDPKSDKAAPTKAKPFLGVVLQENADSLVVTRVVDGSSAAKAGMKVGDRITKMNGQSVSELDEVRALLGSASVGDTLKAEFQRDGKTIKKDVKLLARTEADKATAKPANPAERPNRPELEKEMPKKNNNSSKAKPDASKAKADASKAKADSAKDKKADAPEAKAKAKASEGRPFLGIIFEEEDGSVEVGEVLPDTGGAKAGFKKGDLIQKIAGKKVSSIEDIRAALKGTSPGDTLSFEFKRSGKAMKKDAVLGTRP